METSLTVNDGADLATRGTGLATFDTSIMAGNIAASTLAQYKPYWLAYCGYAGEWAEVVKPSTLARWRQHLYDAGYTDNKGRQRPYAVAAINLRLAAVRSVMKMAAEQGYMGHDVADAFSHVRGLAVKANKERRKQYARTNITKDDMKKIYSAPDVQTLAGKMHRALLMTLATTGVRITELVTLTQEQIRWGIGDDKTEGWQVMVAGKNKTEPTPRALALAAKDAIDDWLDSRTEAGIYSEYVFTAFAGRGDSRATSEAMSRHGAWRLVQRYSKRAGLAHIKPHDFRRYVGTQLAAKDIRLAQKQLGHERIETTAQHYVMDTIRLGTTDDLV